MDNKNYLFSELASREGCTGVPGCPGQQDVGCGGMWGAVLGNGVGKSVCICMCAGC